MDSTGGLGVSSKRTNRPMNRASVRDIARNIVSSKRHASRSRDNDGKELVDLLERQKRRFRRARNCLSRPHFSLLLLLRLSINATEFDFHNHHSNSFFLPFLILRLHKLTRLPKTVVSPGSGSQEVPARLIYGHLGARQ